MAKYPEQWDEFQKHMISGDSSSSHPAKAFGGRGVPFKIVKEWFDAGVAWEMVLYREEIETFRLNFQSLSFDCDGNRTSRECYSEPFQADSHEVAEQKMRDFNLLDEYRSRFAEDGISLRW